MHFAEPLYFYLIALIPLLTGFVIWGENKRRTLAARFVDASLLPRLVHPGVWEKRRTRTRFLIGGLLCLIVALAQPRWGFQW